VCEKRKQTLRERKTKRNEQVKSLPSEAQYYTTNRKGAKEGGIEIKASLVRERGEGAI